MTRFEVWVITVAPWCCVYWFGVVLLSHEMVVLTLLRSYSKFPSSILNRHLPSPSRGRHRWYLTTWFFINKIVKILSLVDIRRPSEDISGGPLISTNDNIFLTIKMNKKREVFTQSLWQECDYNLRVIKKFNFVLCHLLVST